MQRCLLGALAWLAGLASVAAQSITDPGVPGQGSGSASLLLQSITIKERKELGEYQNFGEVSLRAAYLFLDYGLTDRLALTLSLPFKSNRYRGDLPHDPRLLIDDHGERFLDDGRYHSSWGDWGVGLRYLWRDDPVLITPFIAYYHPVRDYPLYTETQAGTGQWRTSLGVNLGGRFDQDLRNLFWSAGYAYNRMQRVRIPGVFDRHVDHSQVFVELSYLLSPQWYLHANWSYKKTHGGLDIDDFTPEFDDELAYQHDRVLRWGGSSAGIGIGYRFAGRYTVSLDYGQTLGLIFGHKYDPAITLGIRRSF